MRFKKYEYVLVIPCLWFAIIGCSQVGDSKIVHPTEENLSADSYVFNADKIRSAVNEPEVKHLPEDFKGIEKITSIGKRNGSEEDTFGFIEDVAFDSFNRVYLLDSRKQLIRVFSREGEYLTSIGGKGEGPGEFQWARSMTNFNDEWLLVNNGPRIEVYDISEEEITFKETRQLEKRSRSLCTMDDQLFIHYTPLLDQGVNLKDGNSLHMIQAYKMPSFEPLYSFGESYQSTTPMVIDRMSLGDISCNEASSTVLFVFERMPVLQGYAAEDGQLEWKSRFDGLHFSTVVETDEGGRTKLTYQMPESKINDQITPPVTVNSRQTLVQVIRRELSPESYVSEPEAYTFILNSSDGELRFLSKELPGIISASDSLIATFSDSYTSSAIYRY